MYGLHKNFLLSTINRTRSKNDFNVKVTSLKVHPSQPKNYQKTKKSPPSAQKKDPFDQLKTAVAKAVFNGERFVLNAKNVLSDLLLEDADTLKNGKLSFLQWLKNEKEIAGANIGNIVRNKNPADILQGMRDLISGKTGANISSALKGLTSNIKIPPPSYLTRKPIPVTNVYPIDQSSPLSVKEQIILQYMMVILGGAFLLAI